MFLVTIMTIIACELVVLMFAFAMHVIPLKEYVKKISKIQLFLSIVATLLGVFVYFYLKTNYSSGIFSKSKWNTELAGLFVFGYCLCLVCSFFRFFSEKKDKYNEETFRLMADEYKIVKEFNFTMGDYIYMPNVKAYCEFGKGIMIFTGRMPEHEVDGVFKCRMVKDGIYECLSYEVLTNDYKKIIVSQISISALFILLVIDVALFIMWISQMPGFNMVFIARLVKSLSFSLFGAAAFNLYKGAKGIFAKLMMGFSIFLIIMGFIIFFK